MDATLLAQLVALMDVYVWKVLRRDRGLSRMETENAMCEMVAALLLRTAQTEDTQ